MLISSLKSLFKPARPARRRNLVKTTSLQDLEPRLFLSVDSLVPIETATDEDATADQNSTDQSMSADVETPVADIDSTTIDNAQIEAATPTVTDSLDTSGTTSSTVATGSDPYFTNVYFTTDGFSLFVNGSITWDGYENYVSFIMVNVYDSSDSLIATDYTDVNGNFSIEVGENYTVTVELLDPFIFTPVDTWTITY
jgi:hypothetical protein